MEPIQRAYQVLGDAERELRQLINQAMDAQKYDHVGQIARLAEGIAGLQDRKPVDPNQVEKQKSARFASKASAKPSPGAARIKGAYPRFVRDGNKLAKIGWSKKSRSEYEHRAPFSVAECLVNAIRKKVTAGELFAATDVLPVRDGDGEAIPDYQAYLALKWLHIEGVVTKHGRDRYAIEPGRLDDQTLERLWSGLPKFDGASR